VIKIDDIVCISSHLESGFNHEITRRKQLLEIDDYVKTYHNNDNVIFVGDTNILRDAILNGSDYYKKTKINCDNILNEFLENWTDVRDKRSYVYTYDPRYNMLCTDLTCHYIDRLYVNNNCTKHITVRVNNSIIENSKFNTMSDHYGIVVNVT
jgi:hypothetical protein